jgi:hypothetical protein
MGADIDKRDYAWGILAVNDTAIIGDREYPKAP